jgi:hypothetical protein
MDLYRIYFKYEGSEGWTPQCLDQCGRYVLEWTDKAEAERCFKVCVAEEAALQKRQAEPVPPGTVWVMVGQPARTFRLVKIPMEVVKEK